jgi:predicted kinase
MIVLMAGLPGTGKSTLARAIALRTSGIVLDKDQIRSTLFPAEEIEYSSEQDDFCLSVMLQTAAYLLQKNPERIIFIDGRPFSKRRQIDQALQAAEKLGQPWRILECVCSENVARQRLEEQCGEHLAANRNYELYRRLKGSWEEIMLAKTVIYTEDSIEACIEKALITLNTPQ